MICPVCEHQQDFGIECDVCGKALGGLDGLGPPPVMTQQIEGLEVTRLEPVGEIPVQRIGELEVTHHAPVAQVALDRTPDVQHTAEKLVGEVAVERVADLSVDRVPDDGQRTVLQAGAITCRYCRTVQAGGSFCERCGMKLPTLVIVPEAVTGTLLAADDLKTRCRSCGAPATAGERCGDCGREVPFPDA
ncbi:MAG: hypothetical protein ACOZQL_24690 [Myxococcota bacterium]